MAISVKKLSGADIPPSLKADDSTPEVVFEVKGADGEVHHRCTDVEAAALAVALSEQEKSDADDT